MRSGLPQLIERRLLIFSRALAALAVLGALAGAVLMFALGLLNVWEAYAVWLPGFGVHAVEDAVRVPKVSLSIIRVIEALDRFLIAIVLLYFGFGVYSLFIRPQVVEEKTAVPSLLHVEQIGELKQVVAEVIIVILFVMFLRAALQFFQNANADVTWNQIGMLLVLPVCTVLLALSLKLANLHPKPEVSPPASGGSKSGPKARDGDTIG